jgi:hypothetical protein
MTLGLLIMGMAKGTDPAVTITSTGKGASRTIIMGDMAGVKPNRDGISICNPSLLEGKLRIFSESEVP